jgi:hypothetical protein
MREKNQAHKPLPPWPTTVPGQADGDHAAAQRIDVAAHATLQATFFVFDNRRGHVPWLFVMS